jgi:putrescine---pyruvate transaminase
VREVVHVPRDDVAAVERALEEYAGQVAAFIGEPVQGAAGVYPPAPGYWGGIQELCRAHDVLLIVDEVVTGFGRLGHWFGAHRYGIEADLIVGAKGLSSGYLPIGVVIASAGIRDMLWSPAAGPFRHGYTYSGHPAACAVALENLRILEEEGLLQRVAELEPKLQETIGGLASHPLVDEVRVAGLLAGVEIAESARRTDPAIVERVVVGARERGVLVRNLLGRSLQISPPLVIEPQAIDQIASTLRETLDQLARQDRTLVAGAAAGEARE